MWLLALLLSVLIGVALGLLGAGGSILTTPVLVYVLGVEPKEAIATGTPRSAPRSRPDPAGGFTGEDLTEAAGATGEDAEYVVYILDGKESMTA